MVTFSIITPVYNGEAFIAETVSSVLEAVSAFEFEYLVIDDGSTDSTSTILSKYGSRIKYFRQENSGQSVAISRAISDAVGKYIIIVNADDPLIDSNLFSDAKEILDSDSKIVATYPDWQIIDEVGNIVEKVIAKEFSIDELVGRFNCLIGPGGIMRASAAKTIGGWDSNYKFVPDYDFWLRLSDFGNFQHIPRIQANWRSHRESISISSRSAEMADERIRVISNYITRHPALPGYLKKMALANAQYRAAVLSYFDKRVNGRSLILKSIKNYPRILLEKDIRVLIYLIMLPLSRHLIRVISHKVSIRDIESSIRQNIKA